MTRGPHAFLFDAAADGVPAHYGAVFDPAVLSALVSGDASRSLRTRIYRGDLLFSRLCQRIFSVSATAEQTSCTVDHDSDLYATVAWDLIDSAQAMWHSLDLESAAIALVSAPTHCVTVAQLPHSIRDAMDEHIRGTSGYLGAMEVDAGNPVHAALFLDMLVYDAAYERGALICEESIDHERHTEFTRAKSLAPAGQIWKPAGYLRSRGPAGPRRIPSERGRLSELRLRIKSHLSLQELVLAQLSRLRNEDGFRSSYVFSRSSIDALLSADLPEEKFRSYLLNHNHPKGRGKAIFFRDVLAIDQNDWHFLAAQLHEGVTNSEPQALRVKSWREGYGASFNATIGVRGRNGRLVSVHTTWLMQSGGPPKLITAYPADPANPGPTAAVAASTQLVVAPGDWEKLFAVASACGADAAASCVPTPMKVRGHLPDMEGACGWSFILLADARRSFARWAVKSGAAKRRGRDAGVQIPAVVESQSYDRARAYALAFAKTLLLNGVSCTVESEYD
jgi:hypothetical protein